LARSPDSLIAFTKAVQAGNGALDNRAEEIGVSIAKPRFEPVREPFDHHPEERTRTVLIHQSLELPNRRRPAFDAGGENLLR
jgi:hypothetical protein